jgi:hypothetical protein
MIVRASYMRFLNDQAAALAISLRCRARAIGSVMGVVFIANDKRFGSFFKAMRT